MKFRTLFFSALIGLLAHTHVVAEKEAEQAPVEAPKKAAPKPPTHIPPPPPNLKPPSSAPKAPPPPRTQEKPAPANKEKKAEDISQKTRKMTLEQLLALPPEQLVQIRDTIDKLVKLSPEEKSELKNKVTELKKLEDSEKAKKREEYALRRETRKQAGILLWERMDKEEKAEAKKAINESENKNRTRQGFINEAMKDREFRKEAQKRAEAVIEKRKQEAAAKRAKSE